MRHQKSLHQAVAVMLVMLFLVGCATIPVTPEAVAATPEPEQVIATPTSEPPTATPEPEQVIATPTPEPPTPTPEPPTPTPEPPTATPEPPATTPSLGMIKGKLMGNESQNPLAKEAVVLCLVSGETQCNLQADLTATVEEDGSFEMADVPPAQYVILYGPSEKVETTWKDLDGLMLDYTIDPSSRSVFSSEFFSAFGGEGGEIEFRNLAVTYQGDPQKPLIKGAIASSMNGLTLEFNEHWTPLTIEVEPDKLTEIQIMATGL